MNTPPKATKGTQVTKATQTTKTPSRPQPHAQTPPQSRPSAQKPPAHQSLASLVSLKSLPSLPQGFIPPHGGYEALLSHQKALVVFDATAHFCARYFAHDRRTTDQMVQAARSGKQNIVEGSEASGTSKETEIKLTSVARASQGELLSDYRDFMRKRGIAEWPKTHPYARRLSQLCRVPDANYETFQKAVEHPDPAICANAIVGLIKVTCYLLDQQLRRLEQDFLTEGGLRERMTRARLAVRASQQKGTFPQ